MHRPDDPSAIAGQFNDNPTVQSPTTKVEAEWLNDIMENVIAPIEAAGIALVKGEDGQLLEAIKWLARRFGVPTGTRISVDGSTCPDGYLPLDGAEYLRADYPELVAFYIADGRDITGSDADHFVVPNYEGYFERAASSDDTVDPGGPRAPGDGPQASQNLLHSHSIPTRTNANTGTGFVEDADSSGGVQAVNTGTSGGTEARPINVPFLWCVKT